jgi:hypothetical protein
VIDPEARLASVEAALVDAEAELTTDLGDDHELTLARISRGRVLVDWEPDSMAGGTLLRPHQLRRLIALHASVETDPARGTLRLVASGRVLAGLSREHAELVAGLGGARRIELRAVLHFAEDQYRGGQETYYLVERGQRLPLLRVSAVLRPRLIQTDAVSSHTSRSRL